jgi:phospholipase C
MDDKTTTYTCPSIYGSLSANNIGWTIYGYDDPPLTRQDFTDITNADESHFGLFTDFQSAAAAGTLSSYVFLEPSWSATGNSQHPNYSVALGEQLIHDVYYALRNGPQWNQTLLIITYDEHGGCYDHVPPPQGAVPPDNSAGEYGFGFAAHRGRNRLSRACRLNADRSHIDSQNAGETLEPAKPHRKGRSCAGCKPGIDADYTAH